MKIKDNKKSKHFLSLTLALMLLLGVFQMPAFAAEPPQMQMILEYESKYDFQETTIRFQENVKNAGWSIVQIFDYKEILGEKGFDILDIQIFAVCSGKHSGAILSLDDERMVSPLMPCTISIYEKSDGKTYIAQLNSGEVALPFGGVIAETMMTVANETSAIIRDLIADTENKPTEVSTPTQAAKAYEGHLRWFAKTTGLDGVKAYADAIIKKEASGIALDDLASAMAFKMDFPALFMDATAMQLQMILEQESLYAFDETIAKLKLNVKEAGWSVVGEFDYKEILGTKGFDIANVKILAVCSGKYSAEILKLDAERMVSPLMPCRIAVYEKSDGKTYIARLNSGEVAEPFGGVIAEVMKAVSLDTEKIVDGLVK